MRRSHRPSRPCPVCGLPLRRIRREPADREVFDAATGRSMRRYTCRSAECGWHGLLPRRSIRQTLAGGAPDDPLAPAWWRRALPRVLASGLVLGVLSVAAAGAVNILVQAMAGPKAGASRSVQALLPAGESHDGEPLGARHPWMRPVAFAPDAKRPRAGPEAAAPAARGAAAEIGAVPPLAMRRGCAWGKPGRNPYRGTVEQALLHARLPATVVRDIAGRVRERRPVDRLEIRTGGIRSVAQGREFDAQGFAMAFGESLCLNSRVNFAPGHVEGADLYEARDERGQAYAVMVPDVCGNVSVLGERGEKRRPAALQVAVYAPEQMPWTLHFVGADPTGDRTVPAPGTLGMVLLGLAAAGAAGRLRRAPSA